MRQLGLFDDSPIARKSDPATSHIAAQEAKKQLTQLQSAFLASLCDYMPDYNEWLLMSGVILFWLGVILAFDQKGIHDADGDQ